MNTENESTRSNRNIVLQLDAENIIDLKWEKGRRFKGNKKGAVMLKIGKRFLKLL